MSSIFNQPWKLVQNRIRGKGGREIDRFRGVTPQVDDASGSEAWIGSTTRVGNPPADKPNYGCSEVILPDGRRMFLFEAIALDPKAVLGQEHLDSTGEGLGVLVKYLDAQAQYGLQCHPTREFAKKMWNSSYGKEESWYVIGTREDTAEPAYILLGFKEGVTRADWEKHYYNNDIPALEKLCHKIEVKVGDAFFVGGGCPHALGEGCFVIEVQEPSDITLGAATYEVAKKRFGTMPVDEKTYDERLLGAYIYDGCGYDENLKRWLIPRKVLRKGDWGDESVVIGPEQTSYFSFTELSVKGEAELKPTGHPQIGIVLSGSGKIVFEGGEMEIKQADEVFLPYSIPGGKVVGDVKIVLCNPEGAKL
ncbi:MAG: class I mannose-6-phosphate isomerase [Christensenellaceae bacterium]|jgi:mannose-6-phosphate isomerase|nr:class I mannose-6-phosphate isomerase [Christensenellaceae bacterium]